MPTPRFFKTEFDMLAINDALGHPNGELAYAYLRVSSSGQAEEGRSGLPRQIQHIHEAALDRRLKIPWEYVFADDDSGFEFVERPELSRLRKEYRLEKRKAHAVVIEHLDRLSRNADWHQGYLLDEMKQFGLQTIFWKQFSSRIERVVMGAVAQDGMEQAKQRMAQGSILKAKSGRVTAKTPAYGYKFVDSFGNEGPTAKKDTHYGIREDEAEVIRYIYRKVLEGVPLRRIAIMLEGQYRPPKRFTHWEPKMIELIVKRSLYKGEFIAHRSIEVKISATSNPRSLTESTGKTVTRKIQRPPEEWIIVPVPAIVDPEDWERANEIVAKNLGRREPKTPFLLTGLINCTTCGYSYFGEFKKKFGRKKETEYLFSNYRCAGRKGRVPVIIEEIGCNQKQISTRKLDQAVWSVIYEVLLYPDIMIEALEKEFASEQNEQTRNQIDYLESQIRELKLEDEQLYKAYLADAFDENEYAEHRSLITSQLQKLQTEIDQLAEGLMTVDQFEERKQEILALCQNAARSGLVFDAPFDVRQKIIHTIVEKITLNANEGWFEIEGVIKGQYLFDNSENNPQPVLGDQGTTNPEDGSIVYTPQGRGSSLPPIENWRKTSTSLWRG
ncbi:MAG: recombinase family protein [Anaerolineales bacterium]|nr:recombinase family protein [Anaerolineales bacterium]